MKKLDLKGSVKEMLSKTKMKQITGGATCSARCVSGLPVECDGIGCTAQDYTSESDGWCFVQVAGVPSYKYCNVT